MYIVLSNGHGGAVVTHLPSTTEVSWSNPERWESWLLLTTDGRQFTLQNLGLLYVLVSSADKNPHRDMTYTVLKVTLKPI